MERGEDKKLLEKLTSGDKEAFEEIVKKYQKPLINYLYNMTGERENARDLAQDVFVKVFANVRRFKPRAKFSTYLYRIATNHAVDYVRRRKHRKREALPDLLESEDDSYSSLEENLRHILKKEIEKLPSRQRAALVLKIYEEKSYAEISEIIGVSLSAVESLLFRARKSLKKALAGKEKK